MVNVPSHVVCFLNINELGSMAKSSIESALEVTECPIYIGTESDSTRFDELKDSRIKFIKLTVDEELSVASAGTYQDFNSELFYQIVQYKWQLLLELLGTEFEYIIFSDTDVYWKRSPINDLISAFINQPNKHMFIQDASLSADNVRLCMGFVVFRNSSESRSLVHAARDLHIAMSKSNSKVGDDDVISEMYKDLGTRTLIGRLPQIAYPVGIFLNLFTSRDTFPGLRADDPFIFHANYTIGLKRKFLLMRRFRSGRGILSFVSNFPGAIPLMAYLRCRLILGRLKRNVLMTLGKN